MRPIISHILITSLSFAFLYSSFSYCPEKVNLVSDFYMIGRLQVGEWIKLEFVVYFQRIKGNYLIWNPLLKQHASLDYKKSVLGISLRFVGPQGRLGLSSPKKLGQKITDSRILPFFFS